jgi:putative phosphoribosyl transferase
VDVAASRFVERVDAGRQLAQALLHHRGTDALVLGLPRGGVPVAAEVAHALDAELDVLVVRKLGVPGHEELAMGAVAGGGLRVLNDDVLSRLDLSDAAVERATAAAAQVVAEREQAYRGDRPAPRLRDRRVVLVDDGLATGATMRVAVRAVVAAGSSPVVVAVPVAPPSACAALRSLADEVVCLRTPASFVAVGAWYDDFSETTDDEVRSALELNDP